MFRLLARAAVALSAVAAPLAAAPADRTELGTTERPVAAFADCFIASQEKSGTPFAYVLNGSDGGTFTTVPAADGQAPYLLSVRDDGKNRRVALSGEAPAATVSAAQQCIGETPRSHAHAAGQMR